VVVKIDGEPALVEGFSSLPGLQRPRLVVPGSSVKGAVRAIVEALTPSCERTGSGACGNPRNLCPACALLGAPGWRATVAFGDLRPVQGSYRVPAVRIAQRYSHRRAPAHGRRLYRRVPESPLPEEREVLLVLERGSELKGELVVEGASGEGLGILMVALGLRPFGLPYLRLGGGKNRGLGIVRVRAQRWQGGQGLRGIVRPDASEGPPDELVRSWQELAFERWREAQVQAARIRREYEEP
jgi:CRISPR/Cas system CMR subunit Cmr4 (Cas7 group RAMP superfamily)